MQFHVDCKPLLYVPLGGRDGLFGGRSPHAIAGIARFMMPPVLIWLHADGSSTIERRAELSTPTVPASLVDV